MSTGQQGGVPSPEERFWLYLAERTGGRFEEGNKAHPPRVVIPEDVWSFVVDQERGGVASSTRCRVLYSTTDGFRFRVCPPDLDLATRLRRMMGAKGVSIGVPYFEKKFALEGTDPEKLKALLDDPTLREQISDLRRFELSARAGQGLPTDTLELRLTLPGHEEDVARLQYLQGFTATLLRRLVAIGSASPTPPTHSL